ncbi:MAG: ankyrin repeat domain-containing protein [Planctomycetota bacterium]
MKYLPLKLGIFVVLLFAAVIAACLLWTPVKIRYYTAKLESNDPKVRVAGIDGLLGMGDDGKRILYNLPDITESEIGFIITYWNKLDEKIDARMYEGFPLHLAVELKYINAVDLFLGKGADPDARTVDTSGMLSHPPSPPMWQDLTPLHVAVFNRQLEAARILIDGKADINAQNASGSTPLLLAVMNNRERIIRLLLDKGADLYASGRNQTPPLHFAAGYGSEKIVKMFLSKGPDLTVKGQYGTPLHHAVVNGRFENVKALITGGADVNARNHAGEAPLHRNALSGQKRITEYLIEHGANVNLKDNDGRAALYWAVGNGNKGVVEVLVKNQADVNSMGAFGYTPLDNTRNHQDKSITNLLRSHGAKTGEELRKEAEGK